VATPGRYGLSRIRRRRVVDEVGEGLRGSPWVMTCLAAGQNTQAEYAVLDAGRPSRRPSTGRWQLRLAWPARLVNAVFACSVSRPVTRSSSTVARAAWERSPCRWRWPAGEGDRLRERANQGYLREIRAIPVLYGEGVAAASGPLLAGRFDAVFDVAGRPRSRS